MLRSRLTGYCLSKKGLNCCTFLIQVKVILHSHFDIRFSQADIHDIAADLLNALLSKIEVAGPPEKVAENDHLMKCKPITCTCPGPNFRL